MKILYQSSDGKTFETSSECTRHERNLTMAIICPNCGREDTRVEMKVISNSNSSGYLYYYVCSECGYKTEAYNDLCFAKEQWHEDKSKFGIRDYSNTNLLPTELTTSTTSGYITTYSEDPNMNYTTTASGTGSTYTIAKEDNEIPTEIKTNDSFDLKTWKKNCKKAKSNLRQMRKELKKWVKEYNPYDYYYLHKVVMMIINDMWFTYRFNMGTYQIEESCDKIAKELWEVMVLNSKIEGTQIDLDPKPNAEAELYKELYSKIGEHIMEWWD